MKNTLWLLWSRFLNKLGVVTSEESETLWLNIQRNQRYINRILKQLGMEEMPNPCSRDGEHAGFDAMRILEQSLKEGEVEQPKRKLGNMGVLLLTEVEYEDLAKLLKTDFINSVRVDGDAVEYGDGCGVKKINSIRAFHYLDRLFDLGVK